MSMLKRLDQDLLAAMKAKDDTKVATLRLVKAAVTNYQIQKKSSDLTEEEVLQILRRQVKQREESIESFDKAGRAERAAQERKELAVLNAYLPAQADDRTLEEAVRKAIQMTGAGSRSDAGKVIKEVMASMRGRAEGKRVSEIVMRLLPG